MNSFNEISNFVWSITELICDVYKRSKYQDVILPFTVLRRIDCVLEPTKDQVLEVYNKYRNEPDDLSLLLSNASGYAFYNTSEYTFSRLLDDPQNIAHNLHTYINGFSDNIREVIENFDFNSTISKLDKAGLLHMIVEKFNAVDLHPDVVGNIEMGYIFEDLIRKFNDTTNDNPGEHYTPREVIQLMVKLLITQDKQTISDITTNRKIYDPCCGTGGMLTITRESIFEINPNANVSLYGQEINPETFAICKSDLYMHSKDGMDAENIKCGSTLSNDQHRGEKFDYQFANPPYGKDWKMDKDAIEKEHEQGYTGRFGAGLPRINDGQLLFLQHMINKMKSAEDGGGRIAIVMNGSPLFTGDAGSGITEIRRWILENDWLDAIVALPEQLFYNTNISTYIWILSNHKEEQRKNKVQLINATSMWVPMRRNFGDKRREITPELINNITSIFTAFQENENCKIFNVADFGYRKIIVERPLRLNFQATPERIERLKYHGVFKSLVESTKKDSNKKRADIAKGIKTQEQIISILSNMTDDLFTDRPSFAKALDKEIKASGAKCTVLLKKAIISVLSKRDRNAEICLDRNGNPEPDADLRDTEYVPINEDVWEYFEREVKPHVPDAWMDESVVDHKDGQLGKIGYEINFNRYFYEYVEPRPLEEIEADIQELEKEILDMLKTTVK